MRISTVMLELITDRDGNKTLIGLDTFIVVNSIHEHFKFFAGSRVRKGVSTNGNVYSGISVIWTPLGQKKVS